MSHSSQASTEYPMKSGVETIGPELAEVHVSQPAMLPYKASGNRQSAFGTMLAHPFATIFLLVIGAELFMPIGSRPHDRLGTGIGETIAREQAAHTEASAAMTEAMQRATVVPPAQVHAVKEAQGAQIGMAQVADFACGFSSFLGQGRNTAYPELRDALRAGCEIGPALRENIVREQGKLLTVTR